MINDHDCMALGTGTAAAIILWLTGEHAFSVSLSALSLPQAAPSGVQPESSLQQLPQSNFFN